MRNISILIKFGRLADDLGMYFIGSLSKKKQLLKAQKIPNNTNIYEHLIQQKRLAIYMF